MLAYLDWNGRKLRIDFAAGRSLAIPANPDGPQPAFFSNSPMRAEPLRTDQFVGDVRQGGSCNAEILHWAPHCHGTHTECIGHVLEERITVPSAIDSTPVLASLVSLAGADGKLTREALEEKLGPEFDDSAALIVRTLPNPPTKQWRDYSAEPVYPVLTREAMAWLSQWPLRHLLLDTPSLDAADNTALENHRSWWGLNGSASNSAYAPQKRSITEMIYVADDIADGEYWLHLGLSPLVSDAAPSQPIIYPVRNGD